MCYFLQMNLMPFRRPAEVLLCYAKALTADRSWPKGREAN